MIKINKIFSKDGKILSEAKEVSKAKKTVAKKIVINLFYLKITLLLVNH